jgi:hypothetical protein
MFSRLSRLVLLAAVTVLGQSLMGLVASAWSWGLAGILSTAAFLPLSRVEEGLVMRLSELVVLAGMGGVLGGFQAQVLRRAGLQVADWGRVTALAVAVGLVAGRALAGAHLLPDAAVPLVMGVAVGVGQAWLLRREVQGAIVWVAACAVGYGIEGPVRAWSARRFHSKSFMDGFRHVPDIDVTSWVTAGVALALATAIGGAFILSTRRARVLPAPGSRMPDALGRLALLGLALPLMLALEARADVRSRSPRRALPLVNARTAPTAEPTLRLPREPDLSPGCASKGCGAASSGSSGVPQPTSLGSAPVIHEHVAPTPFRSAPVVHDEHILRLSGSRAVLSGAGPRINNPASDEAPASGSTARGGGCPKPDPARRVP